jgi:hypothetical protein
VLIEKQATKANHKTKMAADIFTIAKITKEKLLVKSNY